MADSSKPRLIITKLVMENFKSYYGIQEVGEFHKCFSSVVGPNGSGKSNVIDALLFVFGFRAKKIRQAKLKDLIHNSDKHRDLEYCRVSVYFQEIIDRDDGGYDVVPKSEFVVMREANQQSQSTYYLNGSKSNVKDVCTLLDSKGIDLTHNRFLILQGEVESIAMMKPKAQSENDDGLLEYLEDIIGSDRFKAEIAEDEVKLNELNERRNEKLARVKVVQKEKDSLEASKKEAEDYLRLENELTTERHKLFQVYRHQARAEAAEVEGELTAVREAFAQQKAELETQQEIVSEKDNARKKEAKQYDKLKAAADKAKADFVAFERKDIKFRGDVKLNEKKHAKLVKSIEKDRKELHEARGRTTNGTQDADRFAAEIAKVEKRKVKEEAQLETMLQSLKGEMAAAQEKLTAAQEELVPFSKARDEAKAACDLKQAELDLVTKTVRDLEAQIQAAETGSKEALEMAAQRQTELKSLQARQTTVSKELQKQRTALQSAMAEEGPLEVKVQAARSRVEESRASNNQARSSNQVLEALRRQAKRGTISGFHGRLGDLGAIDDKYDVAVSTACSALDHVVVETTAQAQACVEFLRNNNVGRATFIILERIQDLAKRSAEPFSAPEGVPRLYDLVKPAKPQYAVAFYHALRDTLVAEDLDQATRIAFKDGKRFRVVSLQGQLIDTSGTMSGGGTKVARGGMGTSSSSSSSGGEEVSVEELAKMEKEAQEFMAALASCRQRKGELETAVTVAEKELQEVSSKMERFQQDVTAMREKGEALTAQLGDLKKRRASAVQDEAAKSKLEAELAKLNKNLAKAQGEAAAVETKVAAAQTALDNVGGVLLKAQKSKVQSLAEEVATLQSSATRAAVDHKTAMRKVSQLEAKIEKDEQEAEATLKAIEDLKAEFADIDSGAKSVQVELTQASTLLEEQETKMSTLQAEVDKAMVAVNKLKSSLVDVEHDLHEKERVFKEQTTAAKHWEKKLDGLKLNSIEDEEEPEESPAPTADGAAAAEPAATTTDAAPAAKKAKNATALQEFSGEDLNNMNKDDLQCNVTVLEEKLKQLKPNMAAIKEYKKKEQDYLAKVAELDTVTAERDTLRKHYEDLRKQRLDMFMEGFMIITTRLKEMYQMITLGGDAELELVDRLNPFSEGIVFSVRPPKKSWKNISNLSGGEKTLSSLALVFALHHFKPTPLYVMDEIDAALDFKNVSIVANYIKERTKNAQFIIISLRNNMFELADRLIGIYKTDNATKSVTINPELVAAQALRATKASGGLSENNEGVATDAPRAVAVN